jgi:hypothetical protein
VEETVKGINRQVRLFMRLLNSSSLYLMEMLAVYKREVSPSLLQEYVDNLSAIPTVLLLLGRKLPMGSAKPELNSSMRRYYPWERRRKWSALRRSSRG